MSNPCERHRAEWPRLWIPDGAPCPVDGCPNGTPAREWNAPSGARYARSCDYHPQHWVALVDVIALDTATEGT